MRVRAAAGAKGPTRRAVQARRWLGARLRRSLLWAGGDNSRGGETAGEGLHGGQSCAEDQQPVQRCRFKCSNPHAFPRIFILNVALLSVENVVLCSCVVFAFCILGWQQFWLLWMLLLDDRVIVLLPYFATRCCVLLGWCLRFKLILSKHVSVIQVCYH